METFTIPAYRTWNYYDGKLHSTNTAYIWGSRSTIASCAHGCEIGLCLKEHDCRCGLYSVKTLELLHEGSVYGDVYGRLSLHGVVVEFEKGYRSEMAFIEVIYCDEPTWVEPLKRNYPGVEIEPIPDFMKFKEIKYHYSIYDQSYYRRQKLREERMAQQKVYKKQYPGGFAAEQDRVMALLRNKSLPEIQAFATEYGNSREWVARTWAWKPENSRKYKVGSIVFASNDDLVPYFYVGSTRAPSAQASIRLLLSGEGKLVRKTNIRNWDEDDQYKEQRAIAVANW